MKYVEFIEESKTWICPKTGKWKAICVGGGSSGGGSFYDGTILRTFLIFNQGQPTSFGNFLTADGGFIDCNSIGAVSLHRGNSQSEYADKSYYTTNGLDSLVSYACGGEGGYDYGITPKGMPEMLNSENTIIPGSGLGGKLGEPGRGFGAGGGSKFPTTGTGYFYYAYGSGNTITQEYKSMLAAIPGCAGDIKMTIADIKENDEIICSIGTGGSSNFSDAMANAIIRFKSYQSGSYYKNFGFSGLFDNYADVVKNCTAGRDGVIILEYLGG